jgi:gas vesicle protein
MADSHDRDANDSTGGGFMMALLTGTVVGAGLGMLLAPKGGSELRGRIGEQARKLADKASDQDRRADEAASGWAERGRHIVDGARGAVPRGAAEARDYTSGTTSSSYPGSSSCGSTGSTGSSFFSGTTGSHR